MPSLASDVIRIEAPHVMAVVQRLAQDSLPAAGLAITIDADTNATRRFTIPRNTSHRRATGQSVIVVISSAGRSNSALPRKFVLCVITSQGTRPS
jgi:hypothetical protein